MKLEGKLNKSVYDNLKLLTPKGDQVGRPKFFNYLKLLTKKVKQNLDYLHIILVKKNSGKQFDNLLLRLGI